MSRGATAAGHAADTLALAEADSPVAVDALTAALADSDLEVRQAAGLALAGLRDPTSIPALAEIVAGWQEPALARCRRAALHTLVAFRTEEAAVGLAHALVRAGPAPLELEERSALLAVAYAEAAGVAAPRVVRALLPLLGHADEAIGERAASLLMLFPSESHRPLARTLRTASAPEARRRAARALSACRQDGAVWALVDALQDRQATVREAAARSLGDMRDPGTVVALRAAVHDGDQRVREAARSSLHKLDTVATAAGIAVGISLVTQRSAR
jgi:HEAT repeat protein